MKGSGRKGREKKLEEEGREGNKGRLCRVRKESGRGG